MKEVYIDNITFMCFKEDGENRFFHEAEYLDDNEDEVEKFRYIPSGYTYIREIDGAIFQGLMISRIEE